MRARALAAAMALVLAPVPASAHSMQVAYLQLRELADGSLHAMLKTPVIDNRAPRLSFSIEGCVLNPLGRPQPVEDAVIDRFELECEGALEGRALTIDGLGPGVAEGLVSFQRSETRWAWSAVLDAERPSTRIETDEERRGLDLAGYVTLGVEHIALGIDHLLFVLGLLLVVQRTSEVRGGAVIRPLLGTITAFTFAHSITLAVSTLGVAGLPPEPVELSIALSILLLAVELARHGPKADTLTFARPWAVAFGFGLLHGLGFAGALADIGLPEGEVIPALVLFNVGVELGQIAFVTIALAVISIARRALPSTAVGSRVLATYLIGTAASFWCFERGVAVFG